MNSQKSMEAKESAERVRRDQMWRIAEAILWNAKELNDSPPSSLDGWRKQNLKELVSQLSVRIEALGT